MQSLDPSNFSEGVFASWVSILPKLYQNKEHADFEIRCKGRVFKVHKQILVAQSTVFEKAIFGGFKETQQNFMEMPDDDPDLVEAMLQCLYGIDYEISPSCQNSDAGVGFHAYVFTIADKYDVDFVQKVATAKFEIWVKALMSQIDKRTYVSVEDAQTNLNAAIQLIYRDDWPASITCLRKVLSKHVSSTVLDSWDQLVQSFKSKISKEGLTHLKADMFEALKRRLSDVVFQCQECDYEMIVAWKNDLSNGKLVYCPYCCLKK